MGKFVIENILIEKSNKDIKTGINYNFTGGFNLICGDNEAGKSSLMQFIKEGFFRVKNVDTGKIYFNISSGGFIQKYRADIKDSRSTESRLKLYDENNILIDYTFIEKNINQKYFEQGFHINLDDLMSIQNKNTSVLIDIIKDPSGEELTAYVEKKKSEAKKILGENGRLTKEISLIYDKISDLNIKINQLSNKELQYNNALNSIKSISEDIENLCGKEELFNILLKLEDLYQNTETFENQYNELKLNFNEKLYNDKETYFNIIHNAGKFESNLKNFEKNKNRLELLNSKINTNLNRLNSDYALSFNENDLKKFVLDFAKIKQIKDLLVDINILDKDLIAYNSDKENIEEIILRLKHELSLLLTKLEQNEKYDELKELSSSLEEGLREYNFLLSKINKVEQTLKVNSRGISSNTNILILLGSLFFFSVLSAIISFMQKVPSAGIFSVLIAILSLTGFVSMKFSGFKDKQMSEINYDNELKDKLLNSLKDKLKNYYPEIYNIEASYLPFKIESLKQEIQNKIQNYLNTNELIEKNKSESAYNIEKLDSLKNKINEIQSKINLFKDNICSLINADNSEFKIKENIYLEVIDIIKILKESIEEKEILLKEISDISADNLTITSNFDNFIINNEINIPHSEKYEDNILSLKIYNDKNSGIKQHLDILEVEINSLKTKIDKLEQEKLKYAEFMQQVQCSTNIVIQAEEVIKEKEFKQNQKKEAEFQKRELESFEGLNDLKIEKNILLDEYRKKISELVKNKLIISLIETAKNNFDKTRPDLKNAQKYLSVLTEGKYTIINLDLMEIQNENKTLTKKWNELSRGTKEQLYLALRLGYARNYTKDKITLEPNGRANLPLIIDDAFVNFDEKRTKNTIKCLMEFSKTNQVIFFTCHSEIMKKHIDNLCENEKLNVINL